MILSKSMNRKKEEGINRMSPLQKLAISLSVSLLWMTGFHSEAAEESSSRSADIASTSEIKETTSDISTTAESEGASANDFTATTMEAVKTDESADPDKEGLDSGGRNTGSQREMNKPTAKISNLLDDLFDIGDKPQQPKDNEANSNINIEISGNPTQPPIEKPKFESGVAANEESLPEVKVEITTEEEVLPYETIVRHDPTLSSSVTQVLVQGENGSILTKVERVITDAGVQSEKRTLVYYRAPVSRVIVVGTKNSRDSWHDAIRKPPLTGVSSYKVPQEKSSVTIDVTDEIILAQVDVTNHIPQRMALSNGQMKRIVAKKEELPKTGTRQQPLILSMSTVMIGIGGWILKRKEKHKNTDIPS